MCKVTLKNNMKVFRAEKDWTQAELASRVGVTRKTINTIENSKYVPSASLALKIARAFDTSVEEVFQIDEEQAEEDEQPGESPT